MRFQAIFSIVLTICLAFPVAAKDREKGKQGSKKRKEQSEATEQRRQGGSRKAQAKNAQKTAAEPGKPVAASPKTEKEAAPAKIAEKTSEGTGAETLPAAFRRGLASRNDSKACLAQVPKVDSLDMKHLLEGLCLQSANQDDRAIASFVKALKARGTNSDAAFFMGMSYMKKEEYERARTAFEEALWFGKMKVAKIEDAHYRMAQTYLAEDAKDKAEGALNAALAANKDYAPAKVELSELRLQNGQKTPAINLLREALEASPADKMLRQRLVELLLSRQTRPPTPAEAVEAKSHAARLLEGLEGDSRLENDSFPLYAKALIAAGDLDDARKAIASGLKRRPADPELQRLQRQLAITEQSREPETDHDSAE